MQLTENLIRYCLLTNITPPANEENNINILDIFLESHNKGLMSLEQLEQFRAVLEVK